MSKDGYLYVEYLDIETNNNKTPICFKSDQYYQNISDDDSIFAISVTIHDNYIPNSLSVKDLEIYLKSSKYIGAFYGAYVHKKRKEKSRNVTLLDTNDNNYVTGSTEINVKETIRCNYETYNKRKYYFVLNKKSCLKYCGELYENIHRDWCLVIKKIDPKGKKKRLDTTYNDSNSKKILIDSDLSPQNYSTPPEKKKTNYILYDHSEVYGQLVSQMCDRNPNEFVKISNNYTIDTQNLHEYIEFSVKYNDEEFFHSLTTSIMVRNPNADICSLVHPNKMTNLLELETFNKSHEKYDRYMYLRDFVRLLNSTLSYVKVIFTDVKHNKYTLDIDIDDLENFALMPSIRSCSENLTISIYKLIKKYKQVRKLKSIGFQFVTNTTQKPEIYCNYRQNKSDLDSD